jgi:glycerophosphoryl diester phosphodiesterase
MRLIPFPDEKRPLVFGHRGCPSLAPENTLASFKKAHDLGTPGVELDIHLCATGELVVIHDHSTGRVGDADLQVEDSTLAALKAVDIGSKFSPEFRNERIPLLSELFDLLGDSVYYDIEIKTNERRSSGVLEGKLLSLIKAYHLERKVCVSSFNPLPLKAFKAICPDIPTAIIYCRDPDVPFLLRHGEGRWIAGCDFLKPDSTLAGQFRMGARKAVNGRRSIVWTVDSVEDAKALVARGVEGVITNRPQDILPPLR